MVWEHKIVCFDEVIDQDAVAKRTGVLDSYGRAGWELVQVVPQLGRGPNPSPMLAAFFKRPVPEDCTDSKSTHAG